MRSLRILYWLYWLRVRYLEKDYVIEKKDMYIISPKKVMNSLKNLSYSSDKTRRLSLAEIENIILKYIEPSHDI